MNCCGVIKHITGLAGSGMEYLREEQKRGTKPKSTENGSNAKEEEMEDKMADINLLSRQCEES